MMRYKIDTLEDKIFGQLADSLKMEKSEIELAVMTMWRDVKRIMESDRPATIYLPNWGKYRLKVNYIHVEARKLLRRLLAYNKSGNVEESLRASMRARLYTLINLRAHANKMGFGTVEYKKRMAENRFWKVQVEELKNSKFI
jgi:hypothetical protein